MKWNDDSVLFIKINNLVTEINIPTDINLILI